MMKSLKEYINEAVVKPEKWLQQQIDNANTAQDVFDDPEFDDRYVLLPNIDELIEVIPEKGIAAKNDNWVVIYAQYFPEEAMDYGCNVWYPDDYAPGALNFGVEKYDDGWENDLNDKDREEIIDAFKKEGESIK